MAKFKFDNLTDDVRAIMLEEIRFDIKAERLYKSSRFNNSGNQHYADLLAEAVIEGDEETLELNLIKLCCFKETELKKDKVVKVPSNAAQLFAQSEFNRYYIRAVCRICINENMPNVEIYRARESSWSRPESEAKIGSSIVAQDLLEDLRAAIGLEPKLLPEINSGLSIRKSIIL